MFETKLKILEVSDGTYEGNAWCKVKARSEGIAGGRILSFKVDCKSVRDWQKLSDRIDEEVQATLDVVRGAEDSAVLKIVAIV